MGANEIRMPVYHDQVTIKDSNGNGRYDAGEPVTKVVDDHDHYDDPSPPPSGVGALADWLGLPPSKKGQSRLAPLEKKPLKQVQGYAETLNYYANTCYLEAQERAKAQAKKLGLPFPKWAKQKECTPPPPPPSRGPADYDR